LDAYVACVELNEHGLVGGSSHWKAVWHVVEHHWAKALDVAGVVTRVCLSAGICQAAIAITAVFDLAQERINGTLTATAVVETALLAAAGEVGASVAGLGGFGSDVEAIATLAGEGEPSGQTEEVFATTAKVLKYTLNLVSSGPQAIVSIVSNQS
jgi:hypothetical protein